MFFHLLRASFGDIPGVALVVIWGRNNVPVYHSILVEGAPVTWPIENKDFGSRRCKKGLIKIEGSVEERFGLYAGI